MNKLDQAKAKIALLQAQVAELQQELLKYDVIPQQNNQEFVNDFKEEREENIKKMRISHGYNEDGTIIE